MDPNQPIKYVSDMQETFKTIECDSHFKEKLLGWFTKFQGNESTLGRFEREFAKFQDDYYSGLPPFMRNMPGTEKNLFCSFWLFKTK